MTHWMTQLGQLQWKGGWWPQSSAEDMRWIGYVLGALALALLGRAAWRYAQIVSERTRPWRLFMQVAMAGGLSVGECHRLRKLAKARRLSSPLTLLMSGATLEHHVAAYTAKMSASHAAAVRKGFEGIQARFAGEG
jgi:hypothetical protein